MSQDMHDSHSYKNEKYGSQTYDDINDVRVDIAHYDQLFQLAQNHTLLKRDVINVDKQDDGAAYRIFYSETLVQIIESEDVSSNMIGLFENYVMHILTEKLIISKNSNGYAMAESLVMLILVHQDYYSNYPLFLWEHGTEVIEHIFGILRYVFDINGTSISHETIEYLRTWPSEDDIKEAIHIGYDEAMAMANYLKINNRNLTTIQQQIYVLKLQNFEQVELQIESEDIGTAAFEISQLLLDEPDDSEEITDEN
ncbi:hypothetical protein C1645_816768 [Glomus cerebriforme]|uniref:Uncharacterized protein n=1 Tax=Glomus cerebriforme TaxID=658196 RepID=A0A397TEL6_9GLOM|nr:hypothetical protein C1645_816768 [Glomus cerebriforme]